jgi:hypothetical protein
MDSENGSPTPMYDFLREVQEEFNNFMTGEYLGGGKHRAVYASPWKPDEFVIKVERPSSEAAFCNVIEYKVWSYLCETPYAAWLAPCCAISRQGSFLTQKRCEWLPEAEIPTVVPHFFCDCHANNWGRYEGRPVLFDYGFLWGFMKSIQEEKKMRLVSRRNLDKTSSSS